MNGVIILNYRSGRLLFAKQYTPNFGFPVTGSSSGSFKADYLAPLLSSLYLNVTEVSSTSDDLVCLGKSTESHEYATSTLKSSKDTVRSTTSINAHVALSEHCYNGDGFQQALRCFQTSQNVLYFSRHCLTDTRVVLFVQPVIGIKHGHANIH